MPARELPQAVLAQNAETSEAFLFPLLRQAQEALAARGIEPPFRVELEFTGRDDSSLTLRLRAAPGGMVLESTTVRMASYWME